MRIVTARLLLLCACRFEVASVKLAAPLTGGGGIVTKRLDPQQVSYRHIAMRALLKDAWEVKQYQVRGPAWIDSQLYDIVAKLPENASMARLPEMLQSLLLERPK